jgi:hypothetical protein
MRESLIAAAFLVLAFGAVVTADALRRRGDEKDPEQPVFVERDRAKSEAQMAAPVSDADEEAAAPLVAYVVEIGTDELPIVHPPVRRRRVDKPPSPRQQAAMRARALAPVRAFDADPLGAPIPGQHRAEEPALFEAEAERWFAPALAAAPAFPDLPAEPPSFDLEGPTGVFPKDWIAQVMAAAEQKASAR